MGLETATYISDLNIANPTAADAKSQGDDHLRLLKAVLKTTLPNVTGAITASHTELSYAAGVTSPIQGQFAAVQVQFTGIAGQFVTQQASIDAKAPLAGAVYSGTHDFTGAVTTVAAPTLASHAATMLFVQQQAFSAVLPAQAGNAGRYITTNGTIASWADLSGGLAVTTSATSIVLTVASRQLQVITMTADDQSVTLPDATTISAGGPVFTIYNKGTIAFSVRNSADVFLVSVMPGQIATIYCSDKTTAAGFWFIGNESYTGGALTDYAVATALVINAVSSDSTSVVRMADNIAVCAYRGTSTFIQAVCLTVTGAAIVAGAVLTVNGVGSNLTSMAPLTSTKTILTYCGASNFLQSIVLTLSGTTLTAGSAVTVSAVSSLLGQCVTALSSTQAIVAFIGASSFANTAILDISGTVITASAPLAISAVGSSSPAITALTATKAIVVYAGTSSFPQAVVITVTGSSMAAGSTVAVSGNAVGRGALCQISATKAFYAYQSTSVYAHVLDVAGTVITVGASSPGDSGASGFQLSLALLSSTRILIACSGGGTAKAALATISGSTSTIGNNLVPTNTGTWTSIAALTTTRGLLLYAGTSGFLSARIIDKSE